MPPIDENSEQTITCHRCNTPFTKTIAELRQRGVKCPNCGLDFRPSDFRKILDKVDRGTDDSGNF